VIDLGCFLFDFALALVMEITMFMLSLDEFKCKNKLVISYGFGDQAWVDLFLASGILFMYNWIKK